MTRIDALRAALLLCPAFSGDVSGVIRAADFTTLVDALNRGRVAVGIPPFAYSGVPAPAPGGIVHAAHILQVREALR